MLSPAIYLLAFSTVFLLVVAVYEIFFNSKRQLAERLLEIKNMDTGDNEEDELKKPFFERLIRPGFKKISAVLGSVTPREFRNSIERKISYSGNPWNISFNAFVSLQAAMALVFLLLALAFSRLRGLEGQYFFLINGLAVIIGGMLPYNILNTQAQNRQKEIQKALPDVLDLLLVSVEAGLSFTMSLKRVAEQETGALGKEFARALEEMRLGRTHEESLRGIVKRTGVPDLSSFISAVIQSEQLGSNIAKTLRIQASTMRQKRRQRAEEAAMKAPIKMLFPLVFFIFPTLFVVLLGPAFLRIFQSFGDMF
ncbi:MAG: type II secretion system F family protein [Firmicutes bacterium]|jgi:tight adherence protein C|nr:type II secretion system F family protein [Bacillota bacterium]